MSKTLFRIYSIYEKVCRSLILLMTLFVIVSVFLRYVLGITFIWAEETITMLFIASSFYGAVLCVHENEHIGIDFVYQKFSPKVRQVMDIIVDAVIIFVQFYMVKLSLNWIAKVGSVPSKGLKIPIKYFYSMVPISCAIICVYCIVRMIIRLYALVTKKDHVEVV